MALPELDAFFLCFYVDNRQFFYHHYSFVKVISMSMITYTKALKLFVSNRHKAFFVLVTCVLSVPSSQMIPYETLNCKYCCLISLQRICRLLRFATDFLQQYIFPTVLLHYSLSGFSSSLGGKTVLCGNIGGFTRKQRQCEFVMSVYSCFLLVY